MTRTSSGCVSGLLHVAVLVLAAPALAWAQQVYRCGNTYSQTPCAPDATVKRIQPGATFDRLAGPRGYELCAARAPTASGSPEPETARVRQHGERRAEVIEYSGRPVAAHRYDLEVDAKTQYGVYSGAILYSCWVSEDQARVLQFARQKN